MNKLLDCIENVDVKAKSKVETKYIDNLKRYIFYYFYINHFLLLFENISLQRTQFDN